MNRSLLCLFLMFLCKDITISNGAHLATPKLLIEFFKLKNIAAIHLQTCSHAHSWYLMKSLANEFTMSMNSNRTSRNKFPRDKFFRHHRFGLFVDLTCTNVNKQFLNSATAHNMFSISFEWLLWLNKKEDISMLEDTGIQISSEVTAVTAAADLYDLYRPDINVNLIITNVGNWNDLTGLHYRRAPRVYDFQRSPLYGGIFFFFPDAFDRKNLSSQFQDRSVHPDKDIVNRYFYMLNLHLADLYNYTLQLVETTSWGNLKPDGHYTGLIGQLESKDINISTGPLLMLAPRTKLADFMPPMMQYWMPFVFRQPRALGTYRALYLPLMPATWIVVAITLLLATSIFYRIQASDGHIINFSESLVLFIGIFSQQGLSNDPGILSGRMLCLSMLLTAVIVVLHYNAATMTALLSSTPPKIRTLEQLVASNVPLTLMDAPYFKTREVRSRILDKSVTDKVESFSKKRYNIEEGLKIVLNGGAFCAEFFVIYDAIDKSFKDSQKCDLTYIPSYKPLYITSFLPDDSPLREIYMRGFIRLIENGLAQREKNKWIVRKPKCSGKQQFLFVTVEAVTIALAIFAIGVIISVTTLFAEKIVFKRRKNNAIQLKVVSTPQLILPVIN